MAYSTETVNPDERSQGGERPGQLWSSWELPADEVHVWIVSLDEGSAGPDADRILSADELKRAHRLKTEIERRRFVAGRAALRELLAAYTNVEPAAVRFAYGERGKPTLDMPAHAQAGDASALRFNFSHSDGLAVCALVRGAEVGVDVERVREVSRLDRLAMRFFAPAEHTHLSSLPPADRIPAFFRYWTCKEAVLKATGTGLILPLNSFVIRFEKDGEPAVEGLPDGANVEGWSLLRLPLPEGYVGVVALCGPPRHLRIRNFPHRATTRRTGKDSPAEVIPCRQSVL